MAKLVALTEGFKDVVFDLKSEKTTIGRADDNVFPITEPSVSGHHCEVIVRGKDVVVKDLNSTNGTFIDDNKITESPLKPGQILRLGQLELKFDDGTPASATPTPSKKAFEPPRGGVRLNDLEGAHATKVETNPMFRKKSNSINKIFIGVGVVLAVIVIAILVFAFVK
jgi:pSer/pThr/pTyr-binding forkhead associated (FHA) protein